MHQITLEPTSVLVDGGPREGRLVFVEGHLAVVLVRVAPEETAGGEVRPEGWFLEAGFGPCGDLMTIRPPAFRDFEEAMGWVRARLDAGFAPS